MITLAGLLDALVSIPGAILLVVVVVLSLRSITLVDSQANVVVTDGDEVVEVLDPGIHLRSPLSGGEVRVDRRTREFGSTFEDAGTADGTQATLDVALEFQVVDPAAAVRGSRDYGLSPLADVSDHEVAMLEALEVTLLDHARRWSFADLAADPEAFAADCQADLVPVLEDLGIDLATFAVDEVRGTREEETGRGSVARPDATESDPDGV